MNIQILYRFSYIYIYIITKNYYIKQRFSYNYIYYYKNIPPFILFQKEEFF